MFACVDNWMNKFEVVTEDSNHLVFKCLFYFQFFVSPRQLLVTEQLIFLGSAHRFWFGFLKQNLFQSSKKAVRFRHPGYIHVSWLYALTFNIEDDKLCRQLAVCGDAVPHERVQPDDERNWCIKKFFHLIGQIAYYGKMPLERTQKPDYRLNNLRDISYVVFYNNNLPFQKHRIQ